MFFTLLLASSKKGTFSSHHSKALPYSWVCGTAVPDQVSQKITFNRTRPWPPKEVKTAMTHGTGVALTEMKVVATFSFKATAHARSFIEQPVFLLGGCFPDGNEMAFIYVLKQMLFPEPIPPFSIKILCYCVTFSRGCQQSWFPFSLMWPIACCHSNITINTISNNYIS